MTLGKDFLYFVSNGADMFWQVDSAQGVKLASQAVPLEFTPDGWEQISISNVRNAKLKGVDRTITIPFNFVKDGSKILKTIAYKKGIETIAYLIVVQKKLTYTNDGYGYWYKQVVRAEIDMGTFVHDGPTSTVTMVEGGLPKYLQANDSTDYTINLFNDPRIINVAMDGIDLDNTINYQILAVDDYGRNQPGFTDVKTFPAFIVSQDGASPGLEILSQVATAIANPTNYTGNPNYMIRNDSTTDAAVVNLQGAIDIIVNDIGDDEAEYAIFFQVSNSQHIVLFDQMLERTMFNQPFHIPIDQSITLQPGDALYLAAAHTSNSGSLFKISYQPTSQFTVKVATRAATTYIPCMRALDLFSDIISNVSGGALTVDSSLLKGTDFDKVFSSGDGVRSSANSDMKISFNTFLSFFNCFRDVGVTTKNGVVFLEQGNSMVDYSTVTHLGEVSAPKISVRTQDRFNALKIGYPDTNQQDTNGKQAFCTTTQFSLGALRVTTTLDKTTRVIADCFSAENTRVSFLGRTTTDSRQDNDIYVFHIENTLQPAAGPNPAYYKLNRDLNPFVTAGLLQPASVFNLVFCIANCIKNNGSYFRSCLSDSDTEILGFVSTLENSALVINSPDGLLQDNASYAIGSLGDRYFQSWNIEFDTKGDLDILDELDADSLRVFDFTLNGNTYTVIPDDIGIAPNTNQTQTYKMICGKDTDLTPLIDYDGEST